MIVGTSTRLLDRDEGVAARRRASDRGDVDYAAMRRSGDQRSLSEGDRVVTVSIIDHGPGIPEEIAERVFDPFFTTKDPGEGTGLGLSITFGIIQAHGGMLRIRNREGSGAEILVDLPVFQEEQ